MRLLCLVAAPLLVSAVPRPLQPEVPGVVSTYRPVHAHADTIILKEKRKPMAILHVGPHKMASTSVQAALATFHEQLNEDGFSVPSTTGGEQRLYAAASYLRCPKGEVEPCPHMTCPLKCDDPEVQQGWDDLNGALDAARAEGRGIILSAEDFDRPDVRVKELFDALHGFNVTTVVMYRHYFEWIASVYGHLRSHEVYALECANGIPQGCYGSVGWEERRTNTLEDAAKRYTPLVKWLTKERLTKYLEIYTPDVLQRFAEFGAVDTIMMDAQVEGTPKGTLEEAFLCRGGTPTACSAARATQADANVGKRFWRQDNDALVLKNEADTIGALALELAVVASNEGLLPADGDAQQAVSRLAGYMHAKGTGFVPVHCLADPHGDRSAILRRSDQLWEITDTTARKVLSMTEELTGHPLVGLEMDNLKEAYANSTATKLCSVDAKGVHGSKAVRRVLADLFPEYAAQRERPSAQSAPPGEESTQGAAAAAAEPAAPGCGPHAKREGCHPMLTPDDEDGGGTYTDTDAGICLPICYHPNVSKDWSTKCHWMERCKDCKECTGDGLPSRVMARLGSPRVLPPDDVLKKPEAPTRKGAPTDTEAPKKKDGDIWDDVWEAPKAPEDEDAPKAFDDGSWKPPQQQETWQVPDAGICLPICYSKEPNVAKDWSTKCHWMERCKDCKECTGEGRALQNSYNLAVPKVRLY